MRNLLGVNARLEMAIGDPNRPIHVATPKKLSPVFEIRVEVGLMWHAASPTKRTQEEAFSLLALQNEEC